MADLDVVAIDEGIDCQDILLSNLVFVVVAFHILLGLEEAHCTLLVDHDAAVAAEVATVATVEIVVGCVAVATAFFAIQAEVPATAAFAIQVEVPTPDVVEMMADIAKAAEAE